VRVQLSGNLPAQTVTKLSEDFMRLMHDFGRRVCNKLL
jgi:hypothetical protein